MTVSEALYKAAFLTPANQMPAVEKLAFEKYALSYNRIMAAVAGRSNSIDKALSTANTSKAGYLINKTRNQAERMGNLLKDRLGDAGHNRAMSYMVNDTRKPWNEAQRLYLTNTYQSMGKALKAGKPKAAERLLSLTADGRHLPVTTGVDGGKTVMQGGRARIAGRFSKIAPNKMGDAIDRTAVVSQDAWLGRPVTDSIFHVN